MSNESSQVSNKHLGAKSANTSQHKDFTAKTHDILHTSPLTQKSIGKKRKRSSESFKNSVNTQNKKSLVTSKQNQKPVLIKPKSIDVLFGRGGAINNHEGNIHFRSLIHDRKMKYNSNKNTKIDKSKISHEIVDVIKKLNGRFLMKADVGQSGSGDWWVEVKDSKALSKTSQALREGAPDLRAKTGISSNHSRGKRRCTTRTGAKSKQPQSYNEAPSVLSLEEVTSHATLPMITSMSGIRGKCLIRHSAEEDTIVHESKVNNEDSTPDLKTESLCEMSTRSYEQNIPKNTECVNEIKEAHSDTNRRIQLADGLAKTAYMTNSSLGKAEGTSIKVSVSYPPGNVSFAPYCLAPKARELLADPNRMHSLSVPSLNNNTMGNFENPFENEDGIVSSESIEIDSYDSTRDECNEEYNNVGMEKLFP